MKKIITAQEITPKMLDALRELAAGKQPDTYIGRPTRQRLVKFGLAKWVGPTSNGRPLATHNPTSVPGFLPFDWDQAIEITDAGRKAIGKAPISKTDRKWRTLRDKHVSPARVRKAVAKAEEVAKDLVEASPTPREAVLLSAMDWWLSKRPLDYELADHMANPTVNCTTMGEKNLAQTVADLVSKERGS